jgi:DNA polymerase (family 10)
MAGRLLSNEEIARILAEIGEYLAMQDVPFKPRAYEKAALAIQGLEESAGALYGKGGIKALEEIPGVGVSIAEKIEELITTGKLKYYEQLKKRTPVDLGTLSSIEGVGPKSVKKLYQKLHVRNLEDLEKAARSGKIKTLEGFGEKSEENILKGIEFLKKSGGRFLLGSVLPQARFLEAQLSKIRGVSKVTVAGSVRRWKETIGDIDILAVADDSSKVIDYFVSMPEVKRVFAKGETKSMVKLASGLDVDLRVVPAESYGAALNYFTGSKDHNVALRQLAIKRGYKLNEYGLFKGKGERGKGKAWRMVAGRTEEELYSALGLSYIEPELRENSGEIEAAAKGNLPSLVEHSDLKGDLQVQTDWSDGSDSIETMARAAAARGLSYIAVTDHTKRLAMTHGLDEKRILQQMSEIDRVNKKLQASGVKCHVLKGTECDILKDGSLDLPDAVLSKLDVVGVSVHSLFSMSRKEQTARIVRAMKNPNVDILFHPTGRIINRRSPYEVDMDEVIKTAKQTGTALEIDAYPDRLDLKDEHVRKCVEAGIPLSIDSDAHSPLHFSVLEFGVAQARRGWASKEDIINTRSLEQPLRLFKSK